MWTRNFVELQPFSGSMLDRAVLGQANADAHRYLAGRTRARWRNGSRPAGSATVTAISSPTTCSAFPTVRGCSTVSNSTKRSAIRRCARRRRVSRDGPRTARTPRSRAPVPRSATGRQRGIKWPIVARALLRRVPRARAGESGLPACERRCGRQSTSARDLLDLAARHLAEGRVRLVLIGGPPATGKSTLARALVQRNGLAGAALRRDAQGARRARTRARRPPRRCIEGIYSDEWSDRTYGGAARACSRAV